jgi:hypothetical protein|nr:MAG TPA: Intron-binding protein aquarius N-terminus [Caudoviricetes sp.]
MKFNLQFFGGRGGSSHSGGGGGGGSSAASESKTESSSTEIRSPQMNHMSTEERVSALNAMPVGTKINAISAETEEKTNYIRRSAGWKEESTNKPGNFTFRGGVVRRRPAGKQSTSVSVSDVASALRFNSITYPKK